MSISFSREPTEIEKGLSRNEDLMERQFKDFRLKLWNGPGFPGGVTKQEWVTEVIRDGKELQNTIQSVLQGYCDRLNEYNQEQSK